MGRKKGVLSSEMPTDLGVRCSNFKDRTIEECLNCTKEVCRGCTLGEREDKYDRKRNVRVS